MKKIHNSNSLRAVRSKPSPCGKNIAVCQGSANSVNISLKFEVNSTLILPVKCPLTKLEES